jgi:hypothetical protein
LITSTDNTRHEQRILVFHKDGEIGILVSV